MSCGVQANVQAKQYKQINSIINLYKSVPLFFEINCLHLLIMWEFTVYIFSMYTTWLHKKVNS